MTNQKMKKKWKKKKKIRIGIHYCFISFFLFFAHSIRRNWVLFSFASYLDIFASSSILCDVCILVYQLYNLHFATTFRIHLILIHTKQILHAMNVWLKLANMCVSNFIRSNDHHQSVDAMISQGQTQSIASELCYYCDSCCFFFPHSFFLFSFFAVHITHCTILNVLQYFVGFLFLCCTFSPCSTYLTNVWNIMRAIYYGFFSILMLIETKIMHKTLCFRQRETCSYSKLAPDSWNQNIHYRNTLKFTTTFFSDLMAAFTISALRIHCSN